MDDLLLVPGPTNVPEEVLREAARRLVSHRASRFHELYDDLREKLKKILGTSGEVVVLTTSGTGAVEAMVACLVSRGCKALVPSTGEFSSRLIETLRIHGARVVEVEAEVGSAPSLSEVLEKIESENPDVVAAVYNDTSPGVRLSYLKELCKAAKSVGALTLVDAVSAVGGEELRVDEWGIDAIAGASQKCLAAPPGVSFVALSSEAVNSLRERPDTFYLDLHKYLRFAEKSETPFTPAVTLFYALRAALDRILRVGVDNWIADHAIRAQALYSSLEKLSLKPFVKPEFRSRTVLSFRLPGKVKVPALKRSLAFKYGIYVAGGLGHLKDEIIRVGNMGSLKLRDMISLVAAIGLELLGMGVKVSIDEALSSLKDEVEKLGFPRSRELEGSWAA